MLLCIYLRGVRHSNAGLCMNKRNCVRECM